MLTRVTILSKLSLYVLLCLGSAVLPLCLVENVPSRFYITTAFSSGEDQGNNNSNNVNNRAGEAGMRIHYIS